jgi:hypothetical protein
MSETTRGKHWAEEMAARGYWTQKLTTSAFAGLADWLLVHPDFGNCFVEAKKLQKNGSAFVPSQCTKAQQFFLEAVSRHGGMAFILVLGPDRWYMSRVKGKVKRVARTQFNLGAEPYPEGWSEA